MIEKVYDADGVYLGCLWRRGGWLHAEDRIVTAWRFRGRPEALAWLRMRRRIALPGEDAA